MQCLIFDVESTGLTQPSCIPLEQQPSCIEFFGALVDLKTGEISKTYETLIRPPSPLSDKPAPNSRKSISEITGITNDALVNSPSFKTVSKIIFDWIERAPAVIAHNLAFDSGMIDLEAERLDYKIKWPKKICTIEQTIALRGYRLSLANLYSELFNESFAGAHRARKDVETLIKCCMKLHERGMI